MQNASTNRGLCADNSVVSNGHRVEKICPSQFWGLLSKTGSRTRKCKTLARPLRTGEDEVTDKKHACSHTPNLHRPQNGGGCLRDGCRDTRAKENPPQNKLVCARWGTRGTVQ